MLAMTVSRRPLYGNGKQADFHIGIAFCRYFMDIVQDCTGCRSEDTDSPGKPGNGFFVLRRKIPFSIEFFLDLFVLLLQRAYTAGKELFYDKGHGTAFFIDIDSPYDLDLISFPHAVHGMTHTASEQNGPDRTRFVMEIHIVMAVRRPFQTDDTAFHSNTLQAVIALQIVFDAPYDLCYRCIFHDRPLSFQKAQNAAPEALSALYPSGARMTCT